MVLWNIEVQLLRLPDLTVVATAPLGGEIIPRSVALAAERVHVGMGDGRVMTQDGTIFDSSSKLMN